MKHKTSITPALANHREPGSTAPTSEPSTNPHSMDDINPPALKPSQTTPHRARFLPRVQSIMKTVLDQEQNPHMMFTIVSPYGDFQVIAFRCVDLELACVEKRTIGKDLEKLINPIQNHVTDSILHNGLVLPRLLVVSSVGKIWIELEDSATPGADEFFASYALDVANDATTHFTVLIQKKHEAPSAEPGWHTRIDLDVWCKGAGDFRILHL